MSFQQEAVRQWAWVYGSEHQGQCWILSDYDTWERNPFYTGPEEPHPDDYDIETEPNETSDVEADADTLASCGWGTAEDYVCDNDYFDDVPF